MGKNLVVPIKYFHVSHPRLFMLEVRLFTKYKSDVFQSYTLTRFCDNKVCNHIVSANSKCWYVVHKYRFTTSL